VEPALRWSRIHIDDHTRLIESADSEFTPSVGVVFLPRNSLSFYSTYTQGFEAPVPGQLLENGQPLAPVENNSIEAGVKRDGRVSVSAAAYKIRRTNVAEADALGFYRQIAEAQSHGIELEAVGSLTTRAGIHGGYAWCDADITEDASGFAGRMLPNAPMHKANIWVRYAFTEGPLSRLTLSGGVVHVSDRFTASDNVTIAPGYTRADATAAYGLAGSRFTVRLIAQNLSNVRYVTSGAGRVLFAGPPRRIGVELTSAF
jgi:iron complex outermembrane receptor protein